LFTSPLQPSEFHTRLQLASATSTSLRTHFGVSGCAAMVAQEYHPEAAARRMRWALAEAATLDRSYMAAA
jgi:hypothetical protein